MDGNSSQLLATRYRRWCAVILVLTLGQLVLAPLSPWWSNFAGKAFTARLVAYPVMMLALPLVRRLRHPWAGDALGWRASAFVMAPFLVDVTGNSLDLYDRIVWWDDLCHFLNWFLLMSGLGLLLDPRRLAPRLVRFLAITGLGAILAIVWELGEWASFIRFGTELTTAYTDTLGDLCLGTCGAALAGWMIVRGSRGSRRDG